MQVKKFEARTMKEALEMVKSQLGPEAIILSAKDNSKGFGLVGQGSVEITAAISQEALKKKQFAESRMREQERALLTKSPAKIQKQFIEKSVSSFIEENAPRPQITKTRYIEIDEEVPQMAAPNAAQERIKSAAQRAWNALHVHGEMEIEPVSAPVPVPRPQPVRQAGPVNTPATPIPRAEVVEIEKLRAELAGLKSVLAGFQKVPQTVMTQHPGAEFGLGYEFSHMYEKLTQAGVASDLAAEMLLEAQKQMSPIKAKNKALVDAWVAKYILDTSKVVDGATASKIQIFVGPAGSGKTATIVKLASHYVVNQGKKVALVTTDTTKVGAAEQLRIYAQILNVPFAIIRSSKDWDYIQQQLAGYDYILCDSTGTSLKTIDEISMQKNLLPRDAANTSVHLVLSATAKDQDMTEMGRRYKTLGFSDVVFTSLDDSVMHGSIYNFMKRFDVPLHSFGLGPRVPEDYELATRERLLDLIFKLTKMKK
ncbi:MAG: hypothetical protein BroJett040_14410 [Oligoflexia bacterium]|nr:MAG: hypothetical protein BroJett040_14410 [Oligoflexia bacterium]